MPPKIYLICEINCYETEPLPQAWIRQLFGLPASRRIDRQSLWIAAEPYDPEEDDYEQVALRLTGPADPSELNARFIELQRLLERAGVDVVAATVVDD